jgi:hypothetical protein
MAIAAPADQRSPVAPPPTVVVRYAPARIGGSGEPGTCGASAAASYRDDAFQCLVRAVVHDPCFAMSSGNTALCDVDPRDASTGLVVAMTRVAEMAGGSRGPGSRAWLFELHDGTLCRPITDQRREISGATEMYGCKFTFTGEADGVLGELDSSTAVWTVQQVLINKKVEPPTIKSSLIAPVKTVWQ